MGDDPAVTPGAANDGGASDGNAGDRDSDPASDGDGGGDGGPPCDLTKPFGRKKPIDGIPPGGAGARLSENELEVYYSDFGTLVQDAGFGDLVVRKRATRDGSFGAAASMGPVNTPASEYQPSLTHDGLSLYFMSDRGNQYDIYVATRDDAGLFGNAQPLTAVNLTDVFDAVPYVGPKGEWLYFSSGRGSGVGHIYRSERGDGGAFTTPTELDELKSSDKTKGESSAVLSGDELTMYFASDRVDLQGAGLDDIYMATRLVPSEKFGNLVRVEELATAGGEQPSWISPDKCRLYLTWRPTPMEPTAVYVATRGK